MVQCKPDSQLLCFSAPVHARLCVHGIINALNNAGMYVADLLCAAYTIVPHT